jgi:hypothetical protein
MLAQEFAKFNGSKPTLIIEAPVVEVEEDIWEDEGEDFAIHEEREA